MPRLEIEPKGPELEEEGALTAEQIKAVIPHKSKSMVTPDFVHTLNNLVDDPQARESFRENFLGFSDVLKDSNIGMKAYIQAVKYVSFKMMGMSNQEAWSKTFPERLARMQREGKSDVNIRASVCAYNRGKVVTQLLEQSLVPTHILNADVFQEAINTQARLMMTAKSEKVRSDAANSLMSHLKPPEAQKVKVDVGIQEDSSVIAMREALTDLVAAKRKSIEAGQMTAGEVAGSRIIDVEAEVVEK
jgi:hypothetical protein